MSVSEDYNYTEIGSGSTVLILHGLFGSLSNFETMMQLAGHKYRFVMPYLPLYDCELKQANLDGMVTYIKGFIDFMGLKEFSILGNSLGGHLALLYTIQYPSKVKSLILTASSGLFESSLGNEYPKRDKNFLRSKILETFGNKSIVTEELVSEIEAIVNSKSNAIRIIKMAKSATRQNLLHSIHTITNKTLLIWGREDSITPPFVAEKFHQLMSNSELSWIEGCGHAPMMEYPREFTEAMLPFLDKVYAS
jgi:pimeloyl-ACP methyl ester carboxylesterase